MAAASWKLPFKNRWRDFSDALAALPAGEPQMKIGLLLRHPVFRLQDGLRLRGQASFGDAAFQFTARVIQNLAETSRVEHLSDVPFNGVDRLAVVILRIEEP